MLGAESDVLPSEIVSSVCQFFEMNRTWLTKVLEAGVISKEFKFDLEPSKQALLFLSTLEGAMIVGRGLGSDIALKEVAQTAFMALMIK